MTSAMRDLRQPRLLHAGHVPLVRWSHRRVRRYRPWPGVVMRRLGAAESLPAGRLRRERSGVLAVRVVVVPPLVRRGLRVALRGVLPLLLAPERGDVEIAPGGAHVLIAAGVDEVGAEDPVALADEGVVPVPLVHPEVLI